MDCFLATRPRDSCANSIFNPLAYFSVRRYKLSRSFNVLLSVPSSYSLKPPACPPLGGFFNSVHTLIDVFDFLAIFRLQLRAVSSVNLTFARCWVTSSQLLPDFSFVVFFLRLFDLLPAGRLLHTSRCRSSSRKRKVRKS